MNGNRLETLGEKLIELKSTRKIKQKELDESRIKVRRAHRNIQQAKEARIILQNGAVITQEKLGNSFSNLVTLAEASVFSNPYEFKARFIQRRNTSECDLFFTRNGKEYQVLGGTGGGPVDVASFALRISYLAMWEGARPVVILDEPFKNINDPKRVLHRKVAEMVKEVSKLSGFQIIMATQIPELAEIADKVFLIEQDENEISYIASESYE